MNLRRTSGFTLLELTVALLLLALMSSVLYGTLSLSADSWDRGESKVTQVGDMRLAQEFLREALAAQFPLRLHKVVEQPLYFQGKSDSLAFAATLPGRAGGGTYYFRLAVNASGDRSQLALARTIPDYAATGLPDFAGAEQSVLADQIKEVRFGYFGRDKDSNDANAPTWRDQWDDPQTLPLLIRMDVVPAAGPAWPQLVVEPRIAAEAGCRAWDFNRNRCVGI